MGWTTQQAANRLKVSKSFIARLCRAQVLKAEYHGRDWDIDPESVKEYEARPPARRGPKPKKEHTD